MLPVDGRWLFLGLIGWIEIHDRFIGMQLSWMGCSLREIAGWALMQQLLLLNSLLAVV